MDLAACCAGTCLRGAPALTSLALTCLALALKARKPGRAWVSTLTWASALFIAPIFLRIIAERRWSTVVDVLGFFNPGLREDFWNSASVPWTIWPSAVFWFVLSGIVLWITARRFGANTR